MNEDNVCIQEIKRKGAKSESAAQTRVTNARHRGFSGRTGGFAQIHHFRCVLLYWPSVKKI